jgi:hypothetical protein
MIRIEILDVAAFESSTRKAVSSFYGRTWTYTKRL